jgi:DNA-nicking Smr family endonuclease
VILQAQLDIHGMNAFEAEEALKDFLDTLGGDVDEVVVVHGYKGGTVLRDMVRSTFRHKKIKRKLVSMNQGITIFLMKKD